MAGATDCLQKTQPIQSPLSICPRCFCTFWDADLEVQVSLIQVIQGDLLQSGPLQLRQALDQHRLQSHALTQHGRPRVVALRRGRSRRVREDQILVHSPKLIRIG